MLTDIADQLAVVGGRAAGLSSAYLRGANLLSGGFGRRPHGTLMQLLKECLTVTRGRRTCATQRFINISARRRFVVHNLKGQ
eukprot:1178529-Prorocentrum_minimum.AAC.6